MRLITSFIMRSFGPEKNLQPAFYEGATFLSSVERITLTLAVGWCHNKKHKNTINLALESLGVISSWRLKSWIDRLSFLELRDPISTPKGTGMGLRKVKCEIRPNAFANELFRRFRNDYNTLYPGSRSQAHQQRLFVQRPVTKQHVGLHLQLVSMPD